MAHLDVCHHRRAGDVHVRPHRVNLLPAQATHACGADETGAARRQPDQGCLPQPVPVALFDLHGQAQAVRQGGQPQDFRRTGRRPLQADQVGQIRRGAERRLLQGLRRRVPAHLSQLRRVCQQPAQARGADCAGRRRAAKLRPAHPRLHAPGHRRHHPRGPDSQLLGQHHLRLPQPLAQPRHQPRHIRVRHHGHRLAR